MATSELWVPIIGGGAGDDPFRPDVPDDVSWQAEIPCELDPASPDYGKPAVRHALVRVTDGVVGRVESAVPADKVADKDKLLVEMCRAIRRGPDNMFTPEAVVNVLTVFTREQARAQNASGRTILGRLLVHMTRRGLPDASARAIAQQLGIL